MATMPLILFALCVWSLSIFIRWTKLIRQAKKYTPGFIHPPPMMMMTMLILWNSVCVWSSMWLVGFSRIKGLAQLCIEGPLKNSSCAPDYK